MKVSSEVSSTISCSSWKCEYKQNLLQLANCLTPEDCFEIVSVPAFWMYFPSTFYHMKKPLVIYLVDTVKQIRHLNLFKRRLVWFSKSFPTEWLENSFQWKTPELRCFHSYAAVQFMCCLERWICPFQVSWRCSASL